MDERSAFEREMNEAVKELDAQVDIELDKLEPEVKILYAMALKSGRAMQMLIEMQELQDLKLRNRMRVIEVIIIAQSLFAIMSIILGG